MFLIAADKLGWLDERALGGAAEVLLVGDGDQVFELGQGHGTINRFYLSLGY